MDIVAAVWMFLLRFLGIGAQPWRRLPGGPRATRCVVPSVTAAGRPDRRRRYIHVSTPPDASLPAGISWPSASTSALRIVLQPPPGLCHLQSFFVAFKDHRTGQPSCLKIRVLNKKEKLGRHRTTPHIIGWHLLSPGNIRDIFLPDDRSTLAALTNVVRAPRNAWREDRQTGQPPVSAGTTAAANPLL
ncbi:hypothetical protein EC836_106279 [Erwinia sp. JUb26]|nr:hypothetical protein EC836_106279 [Erwinia sp. JUb26]